MATMSEYKYNLNELKYLIDTYTIADVKSMIYGVPVSSSGACCYPALQAIVSLMELLGKIYMDKTDYDGFKEIFFFTGPQYQNENWAKKIYEQFRHGIAHSSLAKGQVKIKKDGSRGLHLIDNTIDVKLLFQDFIPKYEELFSVKLLDSRYVSEYEKRLRKTIEGILEYPWITDFSSKLIEIKKRPKNSSVSGATTTTTSMATTSISVS